MKKVIGWILAAFVAVLALNIVGGFFGSSAEYVYWWDSRDVYHQHYIAGGQIVHISNAPVRVGKIILNLEEAGQ